MDMVDLIQEKKFLGQEFLTWLWFQSDVNSGLIDLKKPGAVEIWFEERIMLESGSGNALQTVTCQGKDLDLAEARTALREGKRVSQAKIRLTADGSDWRFSIKAEGLDLSGVRAPKTLDMDEEEPDSLAGRLLDRLAVMRELTRYVDALFAKFLEIRLSEDWKEQEIPRIRKWLREN